MKFRLTRAKAQSDRHTSHLLASY